MRTLTWTLARRCPVRARLCAAAVGPRKAKVFADFELMDVNNDNIVDYDVDAAAERGISAISVTLIEIA